MTLQWHSHFKETYALRKTIRPMRPKPLIPTCADGSMGAAGCSGVLETYLDNHDEGIDLLVRM